MKMNSKELRIISLVIAVWAIALICVGKAMDNDNNVIVKKTYSINVTKKQASSSQQKSIDVVLKKLEIEVNTPLSTNAKDYIENTDMFSELQLRQLSDTLDTSEVNVTQPGNYKYTLIYKKKKKTGSIVVKEKELPTVVFTLKDFPIPTTGTISTNVKDYINEKLDDEVYKNMILDISEVVDKQAIPGIYDYTITYKGTVYHGKITVVNQVNTGLCSSDATYDKFMKKCICKNSNYTYDNDNKKCVEKK